MSLFSGERADAELVAGYLCDRDEAAFRKLYQRHTPALYRLALRVLRGTEREAEDVVHDTWLCACDGLSAFRGESSLATWLAGIALNRCRERLRADRVAAVASEHTTAPAEEGSRADLERAIAALPDGYREVLLLHDVEGYSHPEIGAILGIEVGTSKSQLSRARKAARALLEGGSDAAQSIKGGVSRG